MPVVGTGASGPGKDDPFRPKYGKHYEILFYAKDFSEVVVRMYDDDPEGIAVASKDVTCTEMKSDSDITVAKTEFILLNGGLG